MRVGALGTRSFFGPKLDPRIMSAATSNHGRPLAQAGSTSDRSGASVAPRSDGDVTVSPNVALEEVLEPVIDTMGYELIHLEWSGSGRHRRLQVFIDHPDGINLDDCSRMSPVISNALDAAEVDPSTVPTVRQALSAPYVLEVSSPGLDRPLSRLAHFVRALGQRVTVKTVQSVVPGSKQKTFHGRLEAADPDPAAPEDPRRGTLRLQAEDGAVHVIPLDLLKRANLIFEG